MKKLLGIVVLGFLLSGCSSPGMSIEEFLKDYDERNAKQKNQ